MPKGFCIGDRILINAGDLHPLWNVSFGELDPFWILGASAAGHLHLMQARPREDAFVIRAYQDWIAVGVADGVGSRSLSRYGASFVANSLASELLRPFVPPLRPEPNQSSIEIRNPLWETTLAKFSQSPDRLALGASELGNAGTVGWWDIPITSAISSFGAQNDLMREPNVQTETIDAASTSNENGLDRQGIERVFQRTHTGIRKYAESLNVDHRELSCTALGFLMNVNTGVYAIGLVGDGAMLAFTADGQVISLLQLDDRDDLQSVQTINSANWQEHFVCEIQSAPTQDYSAFFAMTDGVANDLLYVPLDQMHAWAQELYAQVWAQPNPTQAALQILNQLATQKIVGSYDDRTLVMLTRRKLSDANRENHV